MATDHPAPPKKSALVPERIELFGEGGQPAAEKVAALLARLMPAANHAGNPTAAAALVPWICDALLSEHSIKGYGRDLADFLRQMHAQGVGPLEVTSKAIFDLNLGPTLRRLENATRRGRRASVNPPGKACNSRRLAAREKVVETEVKPKYHVQIGLTPALASRSRRRSAIN